MNERIRELADSAAKYSAVMAMKSDKSANELFVERFAELVRADERRACAEVCYRNAAFIGDPIDQERIFQCAAAIRARGEK